MIITPDGQKLVLDEDELIYAFNRGEIMQSDVDLAYEINCDGAVIYKGKATITNSIPALTEGIVKLDLPVPQVGKCYLKLIYIQKHSTNMLDAGYELGFDEVLLSNADGKNQKAEELLKYKGNSDKKIQVEENDRFLYLTGEKFSYVFNKVNPPG